MEYYDFTLRFDDEDHSLTQRNGLPIDKLADLLLSLSKAVGADERNPLILSEVRGNCYAVQVSTPVLTVHETLKVVHGKISHNDFTGLNTDQKKYAGKLKILLGGKLYLTAYDKEKAFEVEVSEIKMPKQVDYFYEVGSIYGQITSIGGASVEGKAVIHVNKVGYDIEVNSRQEGELLKYYKQNKIRFLVRKKVSAEKNEIVSAILEDFEVISDKSFYEVASEIRKNLPDSFYDFLNSENYEEE